MDKVLPRIVSIVPSLSETVAEVMGAECLAGVTNFCVNPSGLHRTSVIVGGTKDPDLKAIELIKPSHILVNDEENKPEHIRACHSIAPTLLTNPRSPEDVVTMTNDMARFLVSDAYLDLAHQVENSLKILKSNANRKSGRFLYFIWKDPWMIAGRDTYISKMLELTGLVNAWEGNERYPVLEVSKMQDLNVDMVILSTEPWPFRKRDLAALTKDWPQLPKVFKGDGQIFSWYGYRTVEGLEQLNAFLDDEPNHALFSWPS